MIESKIINMENDQHWKWHNFSWLEKGSQILNWKMIDIEKDLLENDRHGKRLNSEGLEKGSKMLE